MPSFERPKLVESVPIDEEDEVSKLRSTFENYFAQINSETGINTFLEAVGVTSSFEVTAENQEYVKGCLAQILEKAYYLAFTSGVSTEVFSKELEVGLALLPTIPQYLNESHERELKRRASFTESIEGTLERFSYIEKLPQVFRKKIQAILVGGSMSYGPFFNIRKNLDRTGSSDIDAIFVMRENFLKDENWESFDDSSEFLEEEKAEFQKRRKNFAELYAQNQADVFSQRFNVPGHDFNMSVHFFTLEALEKMCGSEFEDNLELNINRVKTLRDFKARKFEHKECNQLSFFGETFSYPIPEQKAVEGGYIANLPSYMIRDGYLYLGLYQNLISPEFLVSCENTGEVGDLVNIFHQNIQKRLDKENDIKGEPGSIKESHFRNRFFAPERY